MEDFYLIGVVLAFMTGCYNLLANLIFSFSTRLKNLKKVGYYYNLSTSMLQDSPPGVWDYSFHIIWMIILAPIFSWVTVVSFLYSIIKSKIKLSSLPERLNEFNFKLDSSEKGVKDIIQISRSTNHALGLKGPNIYLPIERIFLDLRIDDGDGYITNYVISPSELKIYISSHTPDFDETDTVLEYKIDDLEVYGRTIESKNSDYSGKICSIKDNIIIESELHKMTKNLPDFLSKDIVSSHQAQIEWNKIGFQRLRYLVLFNHPETINDFDFRKFIRLEIERIKNSQSIDEEKLQEFLEAMLNKDTLRASS